MWIDSRRPEVIWAFRDPYSYRSFELTLKSTKPENCGIFSFLQTKVAFYSTPEEKIYCNQTMWHTQLLVAGKLTPYFFLSISTSRITTMLNCAHIQHSVEWQSKTIAVHSRPIYFFNASLLSCVQSHKRSRRPASRHSFFHTQAY